MKKYAVLNQVGKNIVADHPSMWYLMPDVGVLWEVVDSYVESGRLVHQVKGDETTLEVYADNLDVYELSEPITAQEKEMISMLGYKLEEVLDE